ncbi:MAG: glycoside hydrolase family 3 N-terminal domain-containing protein [Bacteroides sp.]|nr:glycoside hydrolase family 3 N-terminal domain-containing protein [Bacteroides sp.]
MKNKLLQIALLVIILLVSGMSAPSSQERVSFTPTFPEYPAFLKVDHRWADSVLSELSLEDRIAQMIMVQAYSNMGESHQKSISKLITKYHVGGLAFFQGDPITQAKLTNIYQDQSETPLLVAIDGENGLGMRLKNTISYPQQMALGAISDHALLHQMGEDIAWQMKRLGVHLNFAPVADVNNNPSNPVINTRSFGEDPGNVAQKVVALSSGMQAGGLLVAAKHFPGHGDTDTDSHHSLPVVPYGRERMDSLELFPFREAIMRGLSGIMVAHLQVPGLDERENRPATVSDKVVTGLLKEELDFRGLIITDALNMKGLSHYYEPGVREVEAVKAGNDILLMPSDVDLAIKEIKKAVKKGAITEKQINESCKKILLAKYWVGLGSFRPVETASLLEDLNKPSFEHLRRELIAHSLTLVKNQDSILPLQDLEKIKLATVTISKSGTLSYGATTDLYTEGDHYTLSRTADPATISGLLSQLTKYNTIIVSILNNSSYASRKFGITRETVGFIESLDPGQKVILNVAAVPYALGRFPDLEHISAILLSYSDDPLAQDYALQGIFGGRSFTGKLPVSAGPTVRAGEGVETGLPVRLGYCKPLDAGLDPDTLEKMEALISEAIRDKAMPGCQLLVARFGQVVWNRSYGYHTYQNRRPVQSTDLYDLASITKITATIPALMTLRDQGRFSEDSLLGTYHTVPESSNKAGLLIADILSHQAGLASWIPFYQNTIEALDSAQGLLSHNWSPVYALKIGPSDYANRNVKYVDSLYDKSYSPAYPVQVAGDLYLRSDRRDSVYRMINESPLQEEPGYLYSDLGYYLLQQVLEQETDTLLYPYSWYNFYAPMGANTLGFLPLSRFPAERIVPTENDLFFRRQLIHGYVHDPGAAMLGGVAGHAGMFGCANDLAKMMQMYLNRGWYGEDRFIDSSTLATYTSCYDCENENRRGLGFDRPITDERDAGPACDDASASSYGHSGFTGTLAWVDPDYDLVYVFLSNRIHPNQANTKLIDDNVRTRIQQVIYDAIIQ